MIDQMVFELSKEFRERFYKAIVGKEVDFIRSSLANIKPEDITELLEEFNAEESKYVIQLLDLKVGADIIVDLEEEVRNSFLDIFTSEELATYVDLMDSDDGVDLLNALSTERREEVIASSENKEKAGYLLDLLRYDADVAGGLMAKELIKVNVNWTIRHCIDEIRKLAGQIGKIYSVYVVDNKGVLLGKVQLVTVILANDDAKVSDIYERDIVSVDTFTDQEEVAVLMQKYDLDSLPVVNVRGRLVGRITIDDVVDVITEAAEEDRQMMSGISGDVEEDDSVWVLSKARLPWLVIGLVGGLLGARFIGFFEADIILIPAVAFFIPLITATGGNVGIQSSSIVVQSLANPNAFEDSTLRRMLKVLFVAVVNGIILSLIVFGIVIFATSDQSIAAIVAISLFSVVLLASFVGTITPLVLHRFGINPALASGPFITTTNDLLGLAIYFTVAHILYNL